MAIKEIRIKSNIPIYSIGITWILYSLFFKMYRILDFFIVAAISAVVYSILYFTTPDKIVKVTEPDFVKSGDKNVDDVLEKGHSMLEYLTKLSSIIEDKTLKSNINKLHKTGTSIYAHVSENPASVQLIRKFNDYYFPETLKIIKVYSEIDDFDSAGENISQTKQKIEKAVESMIVAFDKQLDNLLYDKTFDVRTDIKVLETLLGEEGLSGKGIDIYEK